MPRLTTLELDAVISVANNVDVFETFADDPEINPTRMAHAFETGMEKLITMLANRRRKKAPAPAGKAETGAFS